MKNTKKINLIFVLLFLGDALLSPFLALNFKHLGYSTIQMSVLLALKPICSLLGNFLYGKFSKGFKRDLNIMKIIAFFNAVATLGFAFARSFALNVVLMSIWSLHNSALFSFCDGVGEKCCTKENKKYFLTRMMGSFGYLIGLVLGGSLGIAGLLNYTIIFSVSSVLLLSDVVLLFFITPFDTVNEVNQEKITFFELFKSKNFIKYMIFYFFVLGIWKIADDYCSQLFSGLGLSDGEWSFLYAGEVVIEIATILILNYFVKKNKAIIQVAFISALLMTIRSFLFALPLNSIALAVSTGILRGIAWGTFIFSFMALLKNLLGTDFVTKGVTLLTIETCALSTIGNFFYLQIAEIIGFRWLYFILGALQCIGLVFFCFIDFSFIKNDIDINKELN